MLRTQNLGSKYYTHKELKHHEKLDNPISCSGSLEDRMTCTEIDLHGKLAKAIGHSSFETEVSTYDLAKNKPEGVGQETKCIWYYSIFQENGPS